MKPRGYQVDANDAMWDHLRTMYGNPVIVLPTGAGKSIIAAMISKQTIEYGARLMILQHRKELIRQNAAKLEALGVKSVGCYSAGLKIRDTEQDVIVAGIQSVYNKSHEFGRRQLMIVDEAHLVGENDQSMYQTFIKGLKSLNDDLRIVGLSATPYRTGEGPLCHPDNMFHRICYEIGTGELISQGYLCRLTNKADDSKQVDMGGVGVRKGEFIQGEMQKRFMVDSTTLGICSEIAALSFNRHSILVFASGVEHAHQIAGVLDEMIGRGVGVVTGDTFPMERDKLLSDFESRRLRILVNCDVLTTGFDAPCIDCIAIARSTMSPGLFQQMVGRGLRLYDGKEDCLILDFGGNLKRHGSIDEVDYGRRAAGKPQSNGDSEDKIIGRGKQCPSCEQDVKPKDMKCPFCGFEFETGLEPTHDSETGLIKSEPKWMDVVGTSFSRHVKRTGDGPPTLRIDYDCRPPGETGDLTIERISEWVCIQHEGFAHQKAQAWWDAHSHEPIPESVGDAVERLHAGACRWPKLIKIQKDGRWWRIVEHEFSDEKPIPDQDGNYGGFSNLEPINEFSSDERPF